MKKKLGTAKQMFQELACLHSNEIKAKDAYPCIKYHILETIARKELSISYIAADYVANALYGWFEYEDPIYYDRFHSKIHHALKFPYKNFGK